MLLIGALIVPPSAHLLLLDGPHLIDDALEDALQRIGGQWSGIVTGDVLEDLIFALGFVDRQSKLVFDAADFVHDCGSLVEQLHNLHVHRVDLPPAIRELLHAHLFFDSKPLASVLARASTFAGSWPLVAFSSMTRSKALPTTTPSAIAPMERT